MNSQADIKSPNPNLGRYVTVLGPTVFVPIAGFLSLWVADNFPGVSIPKESVAGALSQAAIFIVGAGAAHLKGTKWLDGWQKYEARQALLDTGAAAPPAGEFQEAPPATLPDEADIDYSADFDEELDDDELGADGDVNGASPPAEKVG
jgi:hypothetical protein